MIIEYKKENEIAFEDLKDKECFFSNGVLYMKIFSQDLKEYNISCVVKVKSFAPRQIQRRLFAALVTLSRKVFRPWHKWF